MSSRIFQSVIFQMKDATSRTVGVADSDGAVIASTDLSLIGHRLETLSGLDDDSGDKTIKSHGRTIRMLVIGSGERYAIFTDGEDGLARTICNLAYIAVNEAGLHFEENHDKHAFIKNIISENIFPGDVYVRAKELRFDADADRAVLVVRHNSPGDSSAIDLIRELFPNKQNDYVVAVNETDAAVVIKIQHPDDFVDMRSLAGMIQDKLLKGLGVNAVIGIGTPARSLRELADRYKEAQISIQIGKVFDQSQTVISYESLGIGRLIFQLPTTLCEMFLSEVFKINPIEALEQETLVTIDKFFENSLNISETSRKLFVHRNTLVYRLEKIKKITGLDLREFDHAIIFKVALMVKKYLVHRAENN